MKKMLLLLSALIVAPAFAGENVPAASQGVVIKLGGSTKDVAALLAELEKDAVFKDASCSAGKPGKKAKISCSQADGALLTFLSKNAPVGVNWSISPAPHTAPQPKLMLRAPASTLTCPAGCSPKNCPPPGGPYQCCNNYNNMPC